MKKIIMSSFVLFSLTGCFNSVQDDLSDVLESIEFNTNESTATFTMSNVGAINNTMEFEYTISEENSFVKTVKTINSDVETNIIYMNNSNYYLYQNKNNNIVNIELTEFDAKYLFDAVVLERDELYTLTTETTEYTQTTESDTTIISYDERIDDVLYSIKVSYDTSSKQFVSLQKKFTIDNTITTIDLSVSYTLDLELPQGAL